MMTQAMMCSKNKSKPNTHHTDAIKHTTGYPPSSQHKIKSKEHPNFSKNQMKLDTSSKLPYIENITQHPPSFLSDKKIPQPKHLQTKGEMHRPTNTPINPWKNKRDLPENNPPLAKPSLKAEAPYVRIVVASEQKPEGQWE
jgi:hypothetical protein